jgi:hypothetical protein
VKVPETAPAAGALPCSPDRARRRAHEPKEKEMTTVHRHIAGWRPSVRHRTGERRIRAARPIPAHRATHGRSLPPLPALTRRRAAVLFADDTGAATAEYAIATMAAVAFAGMLVVIMRSEEVRGILEDLVRRALTVE